MPEPMDPAAFKNDSGFLCMPFNHYLFFSIQGHFLKGVAKRNRGSQGGAAVGDLEPDAGKIHLRPESGIKKKLVKGFGRSPHHWTSFFLMPLSGLRWILPASG